MIEIEKNIPIPFTKQWIPIIQSMSKGDSFFVPNCNSTKEGASMRTMVNRKNMKIVCRKEGDGMRVWRLQ